MAAEHNDMEARIARLESDVGHIRADLADVKSDLRGLRDRVDVMTMKLSERVEAVNAQIGARIDGLRDEIHSAKIWAVLLYLALAAGMYATMARGFGWI
jgi:hypothetical protein